MASGDDVTLWTVRGREGDARLLTSYVPETSINPANRVPLCLLQGALDLTFASSYRENERVSPDTPGGGAPHDVLYLEGNP